VDVRPIQVVFSADVSKEKRRRAISRERRRHPTIGLLASCPPRPSTTWSDRSLLASESPYHCQANARCRINCRHTARAMITACLSSGKSSITSRRNEVQRRRLRRAAVTGQVTSMPADRGAERLLRQLISAALICILVTSSLAGAEYDGTNCKCLLQ